MASAPTITAPVAAPVASAPVAAPPTLAPPAAEPVTQPVAAPAVAVAEPVAPVVTEGPAEPKAADFQDGGEFLSAHARWENEKAEFDKKKEADKGPEVRSETEPAAEKTEEQQAEEEVAKPKIEEPEVAPTPKELDDILKGDPDLAAALDKNGKAKGAVMKMARELAEAKPIKELFPGGIKSAEFARETSKEYVGLRSKFEAAVDDPTQIGEAFTAFVEQFTLVDDKGQPIKGTDGKPQLAEDFNMLATHMAKLNAEGAMAELEERIAADKYASPEQKERDEQKLLAWKFITEDDAEAPAKADYSALPEAERKEQEAKDARIKELEDQLSEKTGAKSAEQKKTERDTWNRDFGQQHGKALVDQTESIVKELRSSGQNIPQWMLNLRSPGSDVPVLYQNILNDFNSFIKADSYIFKQSKDLSRLAPTPDNLKLRVEYFNGLAKDHLRDIVKGQIKSLLKQEEPDTKLDPPNPSKEPVASGVPTPATGLTMEDAFATAKVQLAKERADWHTLDGAERNAMVMARARQLQR